MSIWTYLRLLSKCSKNIFSWKTENILPKVWTWQNKCFFFDKQNYPLDIPLELKNANKANLQETFSQSMKKYAQSPNRLKHFFWSSSTWKCFSAHHEYTLDNPAFKETEGVGRKIVQKLEGPVKPIFGRQSEKFLVDTENTVVKALPKYCCQTKNHRSSS